MRYRETLWAMSRCIICVMPGSSIRSRVLRALGNRCCPFCKRCQRPCPSLSLCYVGSPVPQQDLHFATQIYVPRCAKWFSWQFSFFSWQLFLECHIMSYQLGGIRVALGWLDEHLFVLVTNTSGQIVKLPGFMHMYYSFGLTDWWTSGMIMYRLGRSAVIQSVFFALRHSILFNFLWAYKSW